MKTTHIRVEPAIKDELKRIRTNTTEPLGTTIKRLTCAWACLGMREKLLVEEMMR